MYGKIFESIYDGSLYGQWEALVTFQQMIVLSDADGTVDIIPRAISARTGIPIDIIEKGIKILESPDPHSRTAGHDGRRIERIDSHRAWGWTIVNHKYYRDMANAQTVRDQTKKRVAKCRADKVTKKDDVTVCNGSNAIQIQDTDIKTLADAVSNKKFDRFWLAYPKKVGKKKSKVAFNRLSEKDKHLILLDLANKFDGMETKYIPNPLTYLHGERWFDDDSADPLTDTYIRSKYGYGSRGLTE